jgi:hypothetical protein
MSINMQGSWTVSVKSKSAAFPQQFVVSGADSGDGTYPGDPAGAPVDVTGASWSLAIQNDPSSGFVNSDDQITFPTASGGVVRFDVQSNDAGGDEDFNDLILTCSTPESATEFIVYGNASCYDGLCLFNPCWRRVLVIDTVEALELALTNPALRVPIEKLYPKRIKLPPPPPPDLEPVPFVPMVLPLEENTAIPAKLGRSVRSVPAERPATKAAKGDEAAATSTRLVAGDRFALGQQIRQEALFDRVAVAGIADHLFLRCTTEKLAGFVLRFQEYDRTNAELIGGPYTGDGARELLGLAATDRNGNYIFRFSRDIGDFVQEVVEDTASTEDPLVQTMPDVVVQLLDSSLPGGIAHESAPYWNVGNLRRINICIPCSRVRRPKIECTGTHRIESIGTVRLGIPANTFDPDGRITATDTSVADVPQARCAAWGGLLRLYGCLGESVENYTIQWRRREPDLSWTGWTNVLETHSLFNTAIMDTVQVGPFPRNLNVSGGPATEPGIMAYENHEGDSDWALSDQAFKVVINTVGGPYAPTPATVEFRIQGYDSTGQPVNDARDSTVRLYINNNRPDLDIAEVTMDSQTGGDCALFDLSDASMTPAVLRVRFQALHTEGLLNGYSLSIRKGNIPGEFPITTTLGPSLETSAALGNSYVQGSAVNCNELYGTRFPDEATAVADYAVAYIIPTSPATNWLESGQTFCSFSIDLSASRRMTNGYNQAVYNSGPIHSLMGIQA